MEHHPFGPSRLYRLVLCPGSHLLEQAIKPPDKPTPAAEEGTWLHLLLARYFRTGSMKLGAIDDPKITPEQEELLNLCIGYADGVMAVATDAKAFPETKLILFDTDDSIINHGTLDLLVLESHGVGQVSSIIDWKFGRLPPNRDALAVQLGCYAAMRLGQAIEEKHPIDAVYVRAFYPRLNREYCYQYAPEDFYHLRAGIRAAIETAKRLPMKLNPSPEACEYCLCLAQCPAAQATAWAMVPAEGDKPPDLTALPGADLGKLKVKVQYALGQLDALKTSVNAEIQERYRMGEGVPGWKVVHRRGRRKIINPQAAYERSGLHMTYFLEAVSVNPTALEKKFVEVEKLIPDTDGRFPTIKALKKKLEEKLGDALDRGPDIPTITKEAQ